MGHTTNVNVKQAPHTAQVHGKFKVFVGSALGGLIDQIEAFTKDSKVAAKSLGVEYLESKSRLVLSIGYRDDEAGYSAKITSKSLGKLNVENPNEIEAAMESAASDVQNVICHEFYVTEQGEFVMVLLSHG